MPFPEPYPIINPLVSLHKKTVAERLKNTKILSDEAYIPPPNGNCYFAASFIQRHLIPRDQIYETMIYSKQPLDRHLHLAIRPKLNSS